MPTFKNSGMGNKNMKSMNKTAGKFLLKCIIIVIMPFVFNCCFVADVHSYTRIMLDELHDDGYIDVLFLGASLTYRNYDVKLIEEKTGLNVFNAGSASQRLQTSYYLLREANEANGVRTVLLDVHYTMLQHTEPGLTETYAIADYLKNKSIKYEHLYQAFGLDGIANGILPVLHSCSLDPDTLGNHFTGDYKSNSYKYVTFDNEEYRGQGFVYNFDVVPDNYVFGLERSAIDPDNLISDFCLEYLNKIIAYCKDSNIELILLVAPMSDGMLMASENYQLYVDAISIMAKENNLQYWDFNLAKRGVLTMDRTDYTDDKHVNGVGAEKISKCISRILNGEIADPFYNTYEEKIINNPDNTANRFLSKKTTR